jgi:hypothetical protein
MKLIAAHALFTVVSGQFGLNIEQKGVQKLGYQFFSSDIAYSKLTNYARTS